MTSISRVRADAADCTRCDLSRDATLRPELVVLLGATAAQAVLGPKMWVTRDRGVVLPPRENAKCATLVTVHPSAMFRMRAPERDEGFEALVHDRRVAATHVER